MELTGKKVLLVEDDIVNQMIAEFALAGHIGSLEKASHGQEAVQLAEGNSFDLILMDLEMPVMDGLEAAKAIRQLEAYHSVPIIALTAHSLPEKLREIAAAGMNGYVVKPFDIDKLRAVLQSIS